MGSGNGDTDELPLHQVTLKSFSLGISEVTFQEYDHYCELKGITKPSDNGWGRDTRPVTNISWDDANNYCKWLSYQLGKSVRLPTEAEWEFAARGGVKSKGFIFSGGDSLNEVSWNFGNSVGQTHPVGTKKENELALFDMSGNVWEWCSDWYNATYYAESPSNNPTGPLNGNYKILRGGSWSSFSVPHGEGEIVVDGCRVSDRSSRNPQMKGADAGFRIVIED